VIDDDSIKGMGCLLVGVIVLALLIIWMAGESPSGVEDLLSP